MMKMFNFLTERRPALVEQSLGDIGVMIDRASEMFAAATGCLLENESLKVDLSELDEEINAREQKIRRSVLEHMAIDPRDELVLSLLLVSIVQDAERAGDLTKSLAKAAALAEAPRMGTHVEALRSIRDQVQALFPKARAAFLAADSEDARVVMEAHDRLKQEIAVYLERLAAADDLSANLGIVLALGARMIGRTSSHLSNIISSVAMPFDQIRRSPIWSDED